MNTLGQLFLLHAIKKINKVSFIANSFESFEILVIGPIFNFQLLLHD